VTLASLHPHMHGRGRDFEYRVLYPTGATETLLSVPRYNWHWQLWYNLEKPIVLPKGTKIQCTAHFDNSPNNPDNADPTKEVSWGDQSWDEMMVGFFNLVFDVDLPVQEILRKGPVARLRLGNLWLLYGDNVYQGALIGSHVRSSDFRNYPHTGLFGGEFLPDFEAGGVLRAYRERVLVWFCHYADAMRPSATPMARASLVNNSGDTVVASISAASNASSTVPPSCSDARKMSACRAETPIPRATKSPNRSSGR